MKAWMFSVLSLWMASSLGAAAPKPAPELIVSAAMSLKPALEEINRLYAREPGAPLLRLNFAASGVLQQHISQGAPVDIFISAGAEAMQALASQIEPDGPRPWLHNRLVLAIPAQDKPLADLDELRLPRFKRIAMGDPKTVPAGLYASDTLSTRKLDQALKDKIVLAHHVRQVVTYLERGEIQGGFVYGSDLLGLKSLKVGFSVPSAWHRPIVYPAAIIKSSKHKPEARRALEFLQNAASRKIWAQYGFILDPAAA